MTSLSLRAFSFFCIALTITLVPLALITAQLPIAAASAPGYQITFSTSPTAECCWKIAFDGATYLSGSGNYTAGNYTVGLHFYLSIACDPYNCAVFKNWTSTGGVTVWNTSTPSTTVTVTGPGSLTANFYLPPSLVRVRLYTNNVNGWVEMFYNGTFPAFGGDHYTGFIWFNVTRNLNGTGADFVLCNYTAVARDSSPRAGGSFSHWSSTGGVSVADPLNSRTNVTISGPGSLTAEYIVPKTTPITPASTLLAILTTVLAMKTVSRRIRPQLGGRNPRS